MRHGRSRAYAAALAAAIFLGAACRAGAAAAEADWVTVSPNKRYLMFEDGRSFVPMGIATAGDLISMDYFGTSTVEGRTVRFAGDHLERLFADMKAHGENFLRIDIEGTGHFPREDTKRLIREGKLKFLESPVGTFSEDYARRVDRLISLAGKYDVYLDLVLIAHTCDLTRPRTGSFDLYPYSAAQGGPLRTMDDLFSSEAARKAWLRRLKWISDRWGGSRRVAVWELYNELLNCGGTDAEAAERWVAEMGSALREHELARYGKAHPVIVSPVEFVPKRRFFADGPGTDLMVTHLYVDAGDSGNPIEAAKAARAGVLSNLARIGYSRPFLENERTLSWIFPAAVQREMEHDVAWSLMASGAASPGATWVLFGEALPFREKGLVSGTHKAMREILRSIDFASFDSRPLDVRSSDPKVLPMAVSDGATVLGWVLHDNPDDYEIDNINAWRAGRTRRPGTAVRAVGGWIRLVEERTGVPRGGAIERAKRLLSSPGKGKGYIRRLAADEGKDAARRKVGEALKAVRSELEEIEARERVLERAYRGHPTVTSELTLDGLRAGAHRVVWYDDDTGGVIATETVSGAKVVLKTPPFAKHIAFTVADEAPAAKPSR